MKKPVRKSPGQRNKERADARRVLKRDVEKEAEAKARDDARRGAHKKASRTRRAEVKDLDALIDAVVDGDDIGLDGLYDEMVAAEYHGGIVESDFGRAIFDPLLQSLTDLPIGLLDQKEELLSADMIPRSKADLLAFCQRLICVTDDRDDLIDEIARGWPGEGNEHRRLEDHVERLWSLREEDRDLYDALVSGRHRAAALKLRPLRKANPTRLARLLEILHVQALLWCLHDVQMVIARNAKAVNPFGGLVESTFRPLAPARVRNLLRARRHLVEKLLDLYFDTEHWRVGRANSPVAAERDVRKLEKNKLFVGLRDEVRLRAAAVGRDVDTSDDRLDQVMQRIAERLRENDDFILEITTAGDEKKLAKDFSREWFSGLSPVIASAVPIWRYIQSETQLHILIEEIVPPGRRPFRARRETALPWFDAGKLPRGSLERAKRLLRIYRREILDDRDRVHSCSDPEQSSDNAGEESLKMAAWFISRRGRRRIGHHHGDRKSKSRTFYLLDIIPEHRLSL